MKRPFQILFLLFILTSCSERFNVIDPTKFNKKIAQRADISTPKELIKIFYNHPKSERMPKLTLNSRKIDKELIEITLIHDNLKDDSQRATKIIMIATLKNKKWAVIEIKTNWKCWNGRGHTNWSTDLCI